MYEKFGQFINGKWQQSSDKATYEVINPANEEVLGKASKATPEDVDAALQSAASGLEVWKKTPPWQRSYIIRKIADKMREKQDVLAKWMTLEVGKPLAESKAEINAAADIFEWNAEETDLKILECMFITSL
jgi:succinate-semialdehyde dehydrogenase/glutarate-semialdehyde dehydrogenase